MDRFYFNKLVRGLADLGLLTVAVWAALNVAVVAIFVALGMSVGEHGMSAILVVNGIVTAVSRAHWAAHSAQAPA